MPLCLAVLAQWSTGCGDLFVSGIEMVRRRPLPDQPALVVVNETLTRIGCLPIEQSISGTEYGGAHQMLRRWIDPCDAVIYLVGHSYGGEPNVEALPVVGKRRRFWTQMEYNYAIDQQKKLYTIVCEETLPFDAPTTPDTAEQRDLQVQHRAAVSDIKEYEQRIELEDEFSARANQWAIQSLEQYDSLPDREKQLYQDMRKES
jgi:hypothetical protein